MKYSTLRSSLPRTSCTQSTNSSDRFVYLLHFHCDRVLSQKFLQLGVLAWCAEFSELIDALKQLGFEGNMFVATRTQALKTCSDVLQLNLEVKMQIIVMYLSSQVQRLRRFLDSERQWDDYPMITFPLPPQEAQRQ